MRLLPLRLPPDTRRRGVVLLVVATTAMPVLTIALWLLPPMGAAFVVALSGATLWTFADAMADTSLREVDGAWIRTHATRRLIGAAILACAFVLVMSLLPTH